MSSRLSKEFELIPIPSLLPDETFYSLCSRYHYLAGNRLAATTGRVLFGHPQQGCSHDFPQRIDEFCVRTQNLVGSADEIVNKGTLLPYYFPFRTQAQLHDAVDTLRGRKLGNLKFQLGLLTSGFRANHPLKACPHCMYEDRATYGISYWHLHHQFPGVWVCTKHRYPLLRSTVKSTGVARFQYVLPTEEILTPAARTASASKMEEGYAPLLLATLTEEYISTAGSKFFSISKTALLFRQALLSRGLLKKSGSLNRQAAAEDFGRTVSTLIDVEEIFLAADFHTRTVALLERLLNTPRTSTHPLRLLVLIFWLFGTWEGYSERYHALVKKKENSTPVQHGQADTGEKKKYLARLIQSGTSITRCAHLLQIDVQTATCWAAQAGYQTPRRPKTLKPPVLNQTIHLLRLGGEKDEIATDLALSVATINRVLRSTVGLHVEWKKARLDAARERSRRLWKQAVEEHPDCGVKDIRASASAAYAWLYRNDRDWLISCSKLVRNKSVRARSRVDWHARDVEMNAAIQQAIVLLAKRGDGFPLPLWKIYQLVPQLKAKLEVLPRLPLTQATLAIARQKASPNSRPFLKILHCSELCINA
jgi:hypothetical protein